MYPTLTVCLRPGRVGLPARCLDGHSSGLSLQFALKAFEMLGRYVVFQLVLHSGPWSCRSFLFPGIGSAWLWLLRTSALSGSSPSGKPTNPTPQVQPRQSLLHAVYQTPPSTPRRAGSNLWHVSPGLLSLSLNKKLVSTLLTSSTVWLYSSSQAPSWSRHSSYDTSLPWAPPCFPMVCLPPWWTFSQTP